MGICASCLGFGQRDSEEPSETEGLLYEDALPPQYGTTAQNHNLPQPDPEELRREREALERICAETSSELIDVLNHRTLLKGSKMSTEYPHLLNKHFATQTPSSHPSSHPSSNTTSNRRTSNTQSIPTIHEEGDREPIETDVEDHEEDDDGEEAWLNGTGIENWDEIKGYTPGALIINLNEPLTPMTNAAKRSLK